MSAAGSPPEAAPPPPPAAADLFGAALPGAEHYARLLSGDGVAHGHIGPREVPLLWSRHIVNSALLTDLVPPGAAVLDVGSGAGLPGLPMALRRDDLRLTLLEPKQRRVDFLIRAAAELGLTDRVSVVRGRAEDPEIRVSLGSQAWIVARAVAPLDRLVGWCLPLLAPRGRLLALKGASAADEVEQHRDTITALSGGAATVVELGGSTVGESTWVVSVQRQSRRGRSTRSAR